MRTHKRANTRTNTCTQTHERVQTCALLPAQEAGPPPAAQPGPLCESTEEVAAGVAASNGAPDTGLAAAAAAAGAGPGEYSPSSAAAGPSSSHAAGASRAVGVGSQAAAGTAGTTKQGSLPPRLQLRSVDSDREAVIFGMVEEPQRDASKRLCVRCVWGAWANCVGWARVGAGMGMGHACRRRHGHGARVLALVWAWGARVGAGMGMGGARVGAGMGMGHACRRRHMGMGRA